MGRKTSRAGSDRAAPCDALTEPAGFQNPTTTWDEDEIGQKTPPERGWGNSGGASVTVQGG